MAGASSPDVWADAFLGTTIADRYRLDRLLGRGASGVVFAGAHTWTDRPVAVKLLLLPAAHRDATLVERFMREAKAAASLPHPNVVDVLDMGQHDGMPFLVLELLNGQSLAELLHAEPRLSTARALGILLPVLDALHAAHARGMVHRDVKAENVFLHIDDAGKEVPKILDFGTVRKSYEEGEAPLTAQGSLLGTPQYMSPEQVLAKPVTLLSDVWSSGILAYRMLAGRFPFDGRNPTVVLADMVTKPVPPLGPQAPEAPAGVIAAIERALQKDPSARHADIHVFLGALLEGAREVGIEVRDPRDRSSRP